ncbi:unnamed protein product [Pleuronectes platessa]|uniref:Uncharacterized protein n=1 Tax=Pleuronectes platessa TaxID=8262 RepID=A0A9N7W2D2_PLEPL|nr:unnamed protein product [Pleuronectes platessa]
MEDAGFVISTAAGHQGVIQTLLASLFESCHTEAQHLYTRLQDPNKLEVKPRYHRLHQRLDSPPPIMHHPHSGFSAPTPGRQITADIITVNLPELLVDSRLHRSGRDTVQRRGRRPSWRSEVRRPVNLPRPPDRSCHAQAPDAVCGILITAVWTHAAQLHVFHFLLCV